MHVFAGFCFVISAVAELAALLLVVAQARDARAQLTGWEEANPERNPTGSNAQHSELLSPFVSRILEERARPTWTVVLLAVGILVGAIGNFASL